jgi:hypothetical protein
MRHAAGVHGTGQVRGRQVHELQYHGVKARNWSPSVRHRANDVAWQTFILSSNRGETQRAAAQNDLAIEARGITGRPTPAEKTRGHGRRTHAIL